MENSKKLLDLLNTQDIGEPYAKKMILLGQKGMLDGEKDKLTAYIVERFLDAEEMEDFERDINYAIASLKRVKGAI